MTPERKKELYELLNGLREDRLSTEQFERLGALLSETEAARVEYVRFMNLCVDLRDFEAAGLLSCGSTEAAEAAFASPLDPELWRELSRYERTSPTVILQRPEPSPQPAPMPVAAPSRPMSKARKTLLVCIGSMAAMMAAMIIYAHLESSRTTHVLATLTRMTEGAQWRNVTGSLSENGGLFAGPLHLSKGQAEIVTADGSQIILEAPVEVDLESSSQLHLKRGRLTVNIAGGQTMSFVVRTPTACVVDLGTELGVEVDEHFRTATHVFQGEVELRSGSNPLRYDNTLRLTKGQGGQADSQGRLRSNDRIGGRFVRPDEFDIRYKASKGSAYHRWKAYSYELRRDPALVAYYPFERDEIRPGMLVNAAAATQGQLNGTLTSRQANGGPTWEPGRWPEKTALRFNREREDYVKVAADAALGINGPITVAAWIHVSDSRDGGHIVANRLEDSTINYQFGYRSPQSPFWMNRMHLARKFGSEPDSFLDWIYSERIPERQGWVFIAATHDNQAVRYYINGRPADTKPWIYQQDLVEADLLIGTAYQGHEDESHFDGKIGEIAILRRAMTDEEIAAMYEAGKP